jgi:hypothetical protein
MMQMGNARADRTVWQLITTQPLEQIGSGLRALLIFLILFVSACKDNRQKTTENPGKKQETAFDETKWKTKEGQDYPFRDQMVYDLIGDENFRELKRDKILDLLGQPDRIDGNHLFYRITQRRIGFWPLHTKTLVIQLSEDSTINWMKIHE